VGLVCLTGCVVPLSQAPREPIYVDAEARVDAQQAVLKQAWKLVDSKFYAADYNGADWATAYDRYAPRAGEAIGTTALYEVVNEMLAELEDAHTGAMTPQESWEDFMAARAFVGINLERIDDHWVVVDLRPGSAAEEAGVKVGWIAQARDGEALKEDGFSFRNDPGRTYVWRFIDENDQTQLVSLVARTLATRMPPIIKRSEEGWIYLRFDEFESSQQVWLRRQLTAHLDAPGVILDLRQNSGGAVWTLERVINDFFPHRVSYGEFVSRKGRRDKEKSAWRSGVGFDGELVVLVGSASASSAEILAHVFQHYERGVLIGRPTAGAVVASRFYRLRDGGELQLGIHDFKSLDAQRLEGNGVQPDVLVERSLADLRGGIDSDLEAAADWLRMQAEIRAVPST
jgi:C-terminal processing protease CtpA/Prc